MMRGIAAMLEAHHGVQVLDEGLEAAVALSHRYIPARQLPDKSVSVLDTACARVAVGQNAVPPELEQCRRRIEALETELAIIARERDLGVDVAARNRRARQARGGGDATRRAGAALGPGEGLVEADPRAPRRVAGRGRRWLGPSADVAELLRPRPS